MAAYRDGLKVATHLFEAAAWHRTVMARCGCGHFGLFDPHGLWWWFHQRRWDDRITVARSRFWCRQCARVVGRRVRPLSLELVDRPPVICLPMPDEREWKRMVNRFRG